MAANAIDIGANADLAEEAAEADAPAVANDVGVPRIVDYFNGWAQFSPNESELLLIRYEDMRKEPEAVMKKVFDFVGTPGTEEQIRQAVEFASYDNMKKLETKKVFWTSGARVRPGDKKNPDSFKVRRAKVGGYRDYFDDQQVATLDRMVQEGLDPKFGYSGSDDT